MVSRKINAKILIQYWCDKYRRANNENYPYTNFILELTLLKELLKKYNVYVILEAIDDFVETDKLKPIKYFASNKVFKDRYRDLIRLSLIIKYIRHLGLFSGQTKDTIYELIKEYKRYSDVEVIPDEDKFRKKAIILELEKLASARLDDIEY